MRKLILVICIISNNINALEEFNCLIEPQEEIELSISANGILESVLVDRGDKVKKGQLLAKLQSGVEKANIELARIRAESQANIMEKQARYELNQLNKARVEELFKNKAISKKELDEARVITVVSKYELENSKMEHQLAQQELKRNQEILNQRSLVSIYNGVVVEKLKSAGEYVDNQQSAILKLAEIDTLKVEVFLPISLFGKIKKGMKAKIIPEESANIEYIAKVYLIGKTVLSDSGNFQISLNLPNNNHTIIPGTKCKLEFVKN